MTLFFTLSGFIITYNYVSLDWRSRPGASLATFTWLRITRLYPALLLFLFGSAVANGLQALDHPILWTAFHVLSIETWIPVFDHGKIPSGTVFGVGWSVSTEIGMYLIFAVAMMLRGRVRSSCLIALALLYAFAVFYLAVKLEPPAAPPNSLALLGEASPRIWWLWLFYCSPYFRILQFGVGAGAAVAFLRLERLRGGRILAAASVLILALLALTRQAAAYFPDWYPPHLDPLHDVFEAVLVALIILNCADQESRLNRVLGSEVLTMIGAISYSLYLFHPFVLRLGIFRLAAPDSLGVPAIAALGVNLITTVFLALLLAYGMYWLVEVPAKRWLRARERPRAFIGRPTSSSGALAQDGARTGH